MDDSVKILIVEDMAAMRKILKDNLNKLGYMDIVETVDGKAALECLDEEEIDIILSDWDMPNMTGIELLREVRRKDAYKKLPFIMITAESQRENVIEAVESGVNDYITKPFDNEAISSKLDRLIKKYIS